ncbi:MucR family transcriptional regulator [Methylobacterium isbiliense]|jgi:predicted transcriptional regulator|uniref:Transcriptional regulatory protein ros n=1 Tax=Methylobacterium isbiliense TaxID=315478 RepID=A0ABQ4SES3_9HYPH|nr:MucR family transcriptional regulator [Methylobacterium isbiliense]MDN3626341.1 MucR family transcriptional regulator [Methylobacterium isbiliense]GJE01736.1 Transcriptional regulatory protein ros [Methylobacterium isbiliense]
MTAEKTVQTDTFVSLASDIVSAYVAKNAVPVGSLPELLSSVHGALRSLGRDGAPAAPEKPVPPVAIRKSVTPDYLISLEDGRQYKSLKRHLATRGLTPEQYRQKWGLPPDYPMVAASYAAQRSDLAKSIGLGQKRRPAA